jgi:hypothetical protein
VLCFDNASTGPSTYTWPSGSSRLPLLAYTNSVPKPPSMSIQESPRVAPVEYDTP